MKKSIIKFYCDKCGKELEERYLLKIGRVDEDDKPIGDSKGVTVDICNSCYRELTKFISFSDKAVDDATDKSSDTTETETKKTMKIYTEEEKAKFLQLFADGESRRIIMLKMNLTYNQVNYLFAEAVKNGHKRGENKIKKIKNDFHPPVTVDENYFVV